MCDSNDCLYDDADVAIDVHHFGIGVACNSNLIYLPDWFVEIFTVHLVISAVLCICIPRTFQSDSVSLVFGRAV